MYCEPNFKTKKELRAAVRVRMAWEQSRKGAPDIDSSEGAKAILAAVSALPDDVRPRGIERPPVKVTAFQPGGIFPSQTDGMATIEGPHGVHRWYARVELRDGQIVRVVS